MAGFLRWFSCFAVITSLATAASASPIQYTAYVMGAPYIAPQVSLPVDLAGGGSYGIGSPALAPLYDSSLAYTRNSVPVNGTVYVSVYATDPQDPTQDGGVSVAVPISGSIHGDGMTSDLQGGYGGTGVSAQTNGLMSTSLPAPLLDLLAHPERVSLSAFVTDGHISDLQTTLGIGAPVDPVPAPEPSVLATLLVGAGAFAWSRCRRTRRE